MSVVVEEEESSYLSSFSSRHTIIYKNNSISTSNGSIKQWPGVRTISPDEAVRSITKGSSDLKSITGSFSFPFLPRSRFPFAKIAWGTTEEEPASAEEENDPTLVNLQPAWLRGFLNRHPEMSSRYACHLDAQRVHASYPIPIKAYFRNFEVQTTQYLQHGWERVSSWSVEQGKGYYTTGKEKGRRNEWRITRLDHCCWNLLWG